MAEDPLRRVLGWWFFSGVASSRGVLGQRASMTDFTVVRGTTTIPVGETDKVLVNGVDYTLPNNQSGDPIASEDCFTRITNARNSGMGRTVGGGNQNPADIGAVVSSFDETTQISFSRVGTVDDTRIDYEIVCWTGPVDSPNRFWARKKRLITLNAATTRASAVTGIVDIDKVMLLVTGSRTSSLVRGDWHACQVTLDYASDGAGGWFVDLKTGFFDTFAVMRVSFAVIEWGPSWRDVQRIECQSRDMWVGEASLVWTTVAPDVAATFDFTQNPFPLSGLVGRVGATQTPAVALLNVGRVLLHQQYRIANSGAQGNDDIWETVEIDGQGVSANPLTHVLTRRATTTLEASKFHVFWIAEWDGDAERPLSVTHHRRYHDTPTGSEEEVDPSNTTADAWVPAIPTVPELDEASVWHCSTSSGGTGAGTPRGLSNFRLTAVNVLTQTRSETSLEEQQVVSIVVWPHDEPLALPSASPRLAGASAALRAAEGLPGGPEKLHGA